MDYASQAGVATILAALTLWIQCAGMAVLIHWAKKSIERGVQNLNHWRTAVLMVRFTVVTIVFHFLEIVLWAGFYRWRFFPTWESSFYFSATSYSTVGYGDIVLPEVWRTLGPVESVMGVLMCGLSVSALFAIVTRLISNEINDSVNVGAQNAPVDVNELS